MSSPNVIELYGPDFNVPDTIAMAKILERGAVKLVRVYNLIDPSQRSVVDRQITHLRPHLAGDVQVIVMTEPKERESQMERWKALSETQTKIFEITKDVTDNHSSAQKRAYKKWDQFIRE